MFHTIRRGVSTVNTTRRIVALCTLGGMSVGTLVGWVTGFFTWITATVTRLWAEVMTWLQSSWGIEHILVTTAAVVLGPLVLIFILIIVISDD
ncbi:hypothetical protein [Psychromicrobium sp. YIM B11713]|uniref:hypothetical protein n=1 Tax=Psychromicrobium sp. YIM B11713 TaxID=3145233 RepID=UPI00374F2782